MPADFDYISATQMCRLVQRKEVSPVELIRRALEKAQSAQGSLNAFFLIMEEEAMAAARVAEAAVMSGAPLGLLSPMCWRRLEPFLAGLASAIEEAFPAGRCSTSAHGLLLTAAMA